MKKQLSQGKDGENRLTALLELAGYQPKPVSKAERSFYDLLVDNDFTVEVKNDIRAKTTGNVAIEVYNCVSDRNSGLSVTRADLWVHIIDNEVWMTSVIRLSSFVGILEPSRIIQAAGDGNATIYLYKKDYIMPTIFHRIDTMNNLELVCTILSLLSDKNV